MKIALCSCGKSENKYIREWVNYYKYLGITKIYLYDNNEKYGERFEFVIKDFIDSGFVEIINWRGIKKPQCKIEQDCWDKHHNEYDWICFFDCDEFLTFTKDDNINGYLNRNCFDNYNIIQVNFLAYGDNDKLTYEDKPLLERFKVPLNVKCQGPLPFPNNCHTKSIIRGTAFDIKWTRDGHVPITITSKHCNNRGVEISANSSVCDIDYTLALIRHYSTKTIEEFILNKFKRGDVLFDSNTKFSGLLPGLLTFFSFNQITNPKIELATNLVKELYETEHNIVVAEARGRIGNTLFTIACGAWYAYASRKEFYLYVNYDYAQYMHDNEPYIDFILKNPMFKNIKVIYDLSILGNGYIDAYEKECCEYNELPPYDIDANVYIHGFRQSPKYFNKSFIYTLFDVNIELEHKILAKYPNINNYVSINIRRGDFLNPANDWICQNNPLEWYYKIINMYDDTQKFLIVSDDIDWCKENFKGDNFIIYDGIDGEDKIFADLWVQTYCKDNVISCSTFSWWAAYLNTNDNKVYYRSPWYKTGQFDMIPENNNWIDVQ